MQLKNLDLSDIELGPNVRGKVTKDSVKDLAELSPEALENFLQETENFFGSLKETYGDADGTFDAIKNQMQNQANKRHCCLTPVSSISQILIVLHILLRYYIPRLLLFGLFHQIHTLDNTASIDSLCSSLYSHPMLFLKNQAQISFRPIPRAIPDA